ncbi:MAG: hypothetical protein LJE96_15795 [Deltaproteobacteria bacterium]|jgi:hypothetical protein|nr:hypothetical protein [Deltaproteobacteria bacterium]
MKNRLAAVMVILLVMCVILGNVPFRNMLVCVHGGGGERVVHLHYGQLEGQPCDETRAGLSRVTTDEERWHFSLDLETISNTQTSFKRPLNMLSPALLHSGGFATYSTAGSRGGYPFYDPSFVFLDPALTTTTILII